MSTVLKSNNFELGLADGTTLTTANSSGGGQSGFTVNVNAGNTCQVSATSPLEDSFSLVMTQGGANVIELYQPLPATQGDIAYQEEFVHATPAVSCAVWRSLQTTSLTGTNVTLFFRADNKIHIFDTLSAVQSPSSTGVLTAGSTYILQIYETTTAITVNIYLKGQSSPVVALTMSTGTAPSFGAFRSGIGTASALFTRKIDNIKVGTGGFLPRTDVSNTPPTASVGPDQAVEVGSTVPLVGSDSDVDGSVTSRLWSWDTSLPGTVAGPTITGNTSQNASVVMNTPGMYRVKYVVTDNSSATSTPVYMKIAVYPHSGDPVTVRQATLSTWTQVGTGTPTSVLNDADDATGHQSPDGPSGAVDTYLMNPHGPGAAAGAITFTVRGNANNGPINRVCKWYRSDGTTLIDTQSGAAPTTLGPQVFTMATAALATIPGLVADRAELIVTITSTAV